MIKLPKMQQKIKVSFTPVVTLHGVAGVYCERIHCSFCSFFSLLYCNFTKRHFTYLLLTAAGCNVVYCIATRCAEISQNKLYI